jgi:prepilin-type N-terminal cleavage/methylation domain-containing protein
MVLESIQARLGKVFRRGAAGMPGVDDSGVTLLEVVIAIALFLVVALGLTSLNAGTWYNTHSSKSYTEGSVLAAQQLEELFSRKYAGNTSSGMSSYIIAGDHGPFFSDDGRYTFTYRVKDDDIMPDTKTVQMTVTFNTNGGKTSTVRYNYLLPLRK